MQSLLKPLSTLSVAVQCLFGLWFGLLLSLHTACGQTSLPDQHLVMYGHSDNAGATDAFRQDVVPAFTVIEGTSSNATFIKELRDQGKVYAAHVINVAGESASGAARVTEQTGVPVIFGVLTTDTIEQAIERAGTKAGNKGAEAACAAIEMARLLEAIGQ